MKLDKALVSRIHQGLATADDFNAADAAEVIAAKTDSGAPQRRFFVDKAFGVEASKRRILGVPHSTERTDRMGDVIKVSGWSFEDFKANPNLFFSHNTRDLPVGRSLKTRKGRSQSGLRALLMDEEFHEADLNPEAELVWRMAAAGALPGRSVGFIAHEAKHPETPEEREKLKLGPWGVLYLNQELLESSIVPVPANADALQGKGFVAECYERAAAEVARAVEEKLLSSTDAARFIDDTPITDEDEARIERSSRRSFVALEDCTTDDLDEDDEEPRPENGGLEPDEDEAVECPSKEIEALRTENTELRETVARLSRAVEALTTTRQPQGETAERGAQGGADPAPSPDSSALDPAALADAIFSNLERARAERKRVGSEAKRAHDLGEAIKAKLGKTSEGV